MVSSSHNKPKLPLPPTKRKGTKKKTLTLWLKTEPFCQFIQGQKSTECRRRSQWIEQRLFEVDHSEEDPNSHRYIADDDVHTIDANLFRKRKHREYDRVKFKNKMADASPYFYCEFKNVKRLTRLPKHIDKKNTITKKPGESSEDEDQERHYYEIEVGEVYQKNKLADQLVRKYKRMKKKKEVEAAKKIALKEEKQRLAREKSKRQQERQAKSRLKSAGGGKKADIKKKVLIRGRGSKTKVLKRAKAKGKPKKKMQKQRPRGRRNSANE